MKLSFNRAASKPVKMPPPQVKDTPEKASFKGVLSNCRLSFKSSSMSQTGINPEIFLVKLKPHSPHHDTFQLYRSTNGYLAG